MSPNFGAQVPNGDDDRSWQKSLASYGLTADTLRAHLRTEVRVMNFVEVRLRPNVHVQPEEIEAYYKNQLLPDLQKNGGKIGYFERSGTQDSRTACPAAHG